MIDVVIGMGFEICKWPRWKYMRRKSVGISDNPE
jgi:hypothetical protein